MSWLSHYGDTQSRRETWDGLATDQLRPVGAILATQGEILEMIATGRPLKEVLDSLCLLIEDQSSPCLCSILIVENDKLMLGAGPNLPEDYACGMDGLDIGENIGPCGTAAFRKEMAIFGDIASSELIEEVRQFILDNDVRACWSIPLFDHKKKVIGTFAISSPESKEPSEYQLALLRTAGFLAGIAISRQLADEEKQRLEADLMHRQKLESLGLMAGGIAHDFNNLLTAVVGCLSLLELEPTLSKGGLRRIRLAQKASDSATDLTTEMLTYAGLASVEIGEVDLVSEIMGVVEVLSPARDQGVRFQTQFDDAVRWIHGDASQLRQVVHNLIQNGLDAVPAEGGEIQIALRSTTLTASDTTIDHAGEPMPPGTYARLSVEDNGVGIATGKLRNIFDPFFSSKRSGRGLGLAMVLGGARTHDGFIQVESSPGNGTEISVYLPQHRVLSRATTASENAANQARLAPLRELKFLLVEDEWSIRELVKDILLENGWQVHEAADGIEGWEQWQRHSDIDVVLLDRCMPGLSGDELMRRIRQDDPHIPIVVTSGYGATSLASLMDEGVDAVLPKPFNDQKLLDIIHRLTTTDPRRQPPQ